MRTILFFIILINIPCCSFAQQRQEFSTNLGDTAPKLRVSKWIKGKPINNFENGKIYVIEFWATWCKPCIAAMPHLSSLALKYKNDVTIIGINVYEKENTSIEKIRKFVDSMGKKMDYNIAVEDKKNTQRDWLTSAIKQQLGIPVTFVINAVGRIAWIGHPSQLDNVLNKMTTNSWDIKEEISIRKFDNYLDRLGDSVSDETLAYAGNRLLPNDLGTPDSILSVINRAIAKEPKLEFDSRIVYLKFSSLLKTNMSEAYKYGSSVIKTSTSIYKDPAYDQVIYTIIEYSEKLKLSKNIFELGALAYEIKINNYTYPELVDLPKHYSQIAEMYWFADDRNQAIKSQLKAINEIKKRKNYSIEALNLYEQTLKKYETN